MSTQKEPFADLRKLPLELMSVAEACKVNLKELSKELATLRTGFKLISDELKWHDEHPSQMDADSFVVCGQRWEDDNWARMAASAHPPAPALAGCCG